MDQDRIKTPAEEWFDAEAAPALLALADECKARGLSFVNVVEFDPGQIASTVRLSEPVSTEMYHFACAAAPAVRSSHAVGERERTLQAQLNAERARNHVMSKALGAIHALLPPEPVPAGDGTAWVHKDPDPHKLLALLAQRIRAVPDEIAKANGHSAPQDAHTAHMSISEASGGACLSVEIPAGASGVDISSDGGKTWTHIKR